MFGLDNNAIPFGLTIDKERLLLIFRKSFFNESECELATCLGFHQDGNVIYCQLKKTSKNALFEFIKFSFPEFVMNDTFKEMRDGLYRALVEIYSEIRVQFDNIALDIFTRYNEAYEHQKECIMLGVLRDENIFALEQGLGKSFISICVGVIMKFKTNLIITPATSKWNFVEELLDWGFDINDITIIDSQNSRQGWTNKFVLINYDLLESYEEKLLSLDIGHIISDECHLAKNMDSNRTKIVHSLIEKTKPKLSLLSGTPTPNKIEDIFSYLRMTNHPFGKSKREFEKRFVEKISLPGGDVVTRGKNIDVLYRAISNLVIRKTKAKCLDLPPKNYHKVVLDLGDYKEEYDSYYEEMLQLLDSNKNFDIAIQRLNIITGKSKLRGTISLIDKIIDKKHIVYENKTFIEKSSVRILKNSKEEVGGKVVIFSVHTEPLNMLEQHYGSRCVKVDGTVSSKKRLELVNKFKTNNGINVFLGQTTAAGIGLNIVNKKSNKANPPIYSVIHLTFPFTNAQFEQANDRVHRIGQWWEEGVDIYYMVAKDTIDETILSLVERKYEDVSELIDGQREGFDFTNVSLDALTQIKTILQVERQSAARIIKESIQGYVQ